MKIQIDKPCHENWEEMTLKEKGRFCGACKKIVLDMTKYNDQEIISFFKEKKYDVCGQLETNQIDRELIPNHESKLSRLKKSLIAASLAGIIAGLNTVTAQSSLVRVETSDKKESDQNQKDEYNIDETVVFLIKGKVVDANNKAISGAIISINSDRVKSDNNGEFEVSLGLFYDTEPLDVIANVSAKGKKTKSIRLSLDFDQTTLDMGTLQLANTGHQHVKGKIKVVD